MISTDDNRFYIEAIDQWENLEMEQNTSGNSLFVKEKIEGNNFEIQVPKILPPHQAQILKKL